MEKARARRADDVRGALIAALCVLSFVGGAAYTKADLWLTSGQTPASKTHQVVQPLTNSNKDERAPTAGQSARVETASVPSSVLTQEQVDEWQTVRVRVTAYCPCPKCCGQYADGMTACGHVIEAGDTFVAADKRYTFGTEMVVPGYSHGRAVKVLDRGGAIQGNRIDVFFRSHQEALEWGVKYLDVKVRTK